jgi:ABC-2 type transport system ATP-binding protein
MASHYVARFEEIDKSYGDHVALKNVSLEVETGEVFGLLGPNGAGKTTLIRILMDIIRSNSGTIEVFGEPFHRELLDRVGYLPEERGLYKKIKVLDVMVYFARLKGLSHKEATSRSRDWLNRVKLGDVAGEKIQQLSKGMTQKVQIASTLLSEPELVVLDEPFSGLDPVNIELVRALIEERRQAGLTTILSTHQMNMIEAVCDRVAMIHQGERVLYGRVDEIRETWSPPQVEVRMQGSPPTLAKVSKNEPLSEGLWRLHLADDVTPESVLRELVQAGCEVREFHRVLASMQEIFVRVAGVDSLDEEDAA